MTFDRREKCARLAKKKIARRARAMILLIRIKLRREREREKQPRTTPPISAGLDFNRITHEFPDKTADDLRIETAQSESED